MQNQQPFRALLLEELPPTISDLKASETYGMHMKRKKVLGMVVWEVLFIVVVFLGIKAFVLYRLGQMLPIDTTGKMELIALDVFITIGFLASLFFQAHLPTKVLRFFYKVGSSWLFTCCVYLLIILGLIDLLRVANLLPAQSIFYKNWYGIALLAAVMACILIFGYCNYLRKVRVELSLNLAHKAMHTSVKIIAMGDLHLGYSTDKKELEGWIELINQESPDLVLFVGDIVDNSILPLYEQGLASAFKAIKAKHGVFAVLGNHEYISGVSQSMAFLAQAGITVLRDTSVLVGDQLHIVGRDDKTNSGRKTLQELTQSLDFSKPVILLDHQPYHLEETGKAQIDLQLSGHTHHGQIWPISLITGFLFEKSHGYLKKNNTHIYVTSGIGLWGGKFRIGSQSEYIVINLTL